METTGLLVGDGCDDARTSSRPLTRQAGWRDPVRAMEQAAVGFTSLHCTAMQRIVQCSVRCAVCRLKCAVCSVQCAVCSVQSTECSAVQRGWPHRARFFAQLSRPSGRPRVCRKSSSQPTSRLYFFPAIRQSSYHPLPPPLISAGLFPFQTVRNASCPPP